jgi:hypothetical protein
VRPLLIALTALLLLAPAAYADERIQAGPPNRYLTPNPTMDQGEPLYFENSDVQDHDVTSRANAADGKPLFSSDLIGRGERAFVNNSQYLTTGQYQFFCSIHTDMTGTLTVTSAGTPASRGGPGGGGQPGGAGDKEAPKVTLKVRSGKIGRVRRSRKLQVQVTVNEAAKVTLGATARVGRKNVKIATGSVNLTGAGVRREGLGLTSAGRKALKRRSRLAVSVSARAVDRAGNAARSRARVRLK